MPTKSGYLANEVRDAAMETPIERTPPTGKRVLLMATCLCDAVYADVARATVEVLEHAGCEVIFPEEQTCCGQPAFNSGDWKSSRTVSLHTQRTFAGPLPVIIPSASCAGMVRHGAMLAFEKDKGLTGAKELATRTWELADFLVNGLGVSRWPGRYEKSVAFHRSCHSRGSESAASAEKLLASIAGLRLVDFAEREQCCGFGGTFSVSFPTISAGMGVLKLNAVADSKAEELVSGDMSCMMHVGGLAEKEGRPLVTRHFAQVLRDALAQGGRG